MSKTFASFVAAAAALAPFAAGQNQDVVIPAIAEGRDANDLASYPFGRTGFRTQQILSQAALARSAPTGAILLGIAYRADNDNSSGSPAVTIPNVTIEMSQTSVIPATMSTDFASNITNSPVTVFQGSVNLPAYSSTPNGHASFGAGIPLTAPFLFTTGAGDLLIDITAANANSTRNNYVIDAALPGGTVSTYGMPGQLSQPDGVRTVIAGNGSMGRFSGIVPGGQFSILVQSQFQVWSGALMLGLDKLSQPIDLASVGAPNNHLYIDPIDSYPYTLQQPPIGWGFRYSWNLAVPSDPTLTGVGLHMQPFVADPAANTLGVATMSATEVVIGDSAPHPVRQLNASDYQATTGSFQYVSGIYGGAVVQLTGQFQ